MLSINIAGGMREHEAHKNHERKETQEIDCYYGVFLFSRPLFCFVRLKCIIDGWKTEFLVHSVLFSLPKMDESLQALWIMDV